MDVYEIRRTRLRELIDTRFAGRQVDLANAIGRQPDYISRCVNGKTRIGDLARTIERELELPIGWLDTFTGEKPPKEGQSQGNSDSPDTDNHSTDPQEAEAVVIDWNEVDDFDTVVRTPGAREVLRKTQTRNGRGFALRMRDDSMLPTLAVGSRVLIDPDEPPEHDDVVLVGEADSPPVLRRLIIQGSQKLLKADNERYGPLTPITPAQYFIGVAIDAVVPLKRPKPKA